MAVRGGSCGLIAHEPMGSKHYNACLAGPAMELGLDYALYCLFVTISNWAAMVRHVGPLTPDVPLDAAIGLVYP